MRPGIPEQPDIRTLYKVTFTSYDGTPFFLHTTDPGKIGPWLAEMYGMFPYLASAETSVDIKTVDGLRFGR